MQPAISEQYEKNLKEYQKIHPPKSGIKRFLQSSARPARNVALITLGACAVIGTLTLAAYRLGLTKSLVKGSTSWQ